MRTQADRAAVSDMLAARADVTVLTGAEDALKRMLTVLLVDGDTCYSATVMLNAQADWAAVTEMLAARAGIPTLTGADDDQKRMLVEVLVDGGMLFSHSYAHAQAD